MKPREVPIGTRIENTSARATTRAGASVSTCKGMTQENIDDCLDVIEVLKHANPTSIPLIYKIVSLFLALGPLNTMMLQKALCGYTLTETAIFMGTSKQGAHQRWGRLADVFPELEKVYKKRRRLK